MAFKKYIKRGNKIYGPYYYRSYRVGNQVKKEYLGKNYLERVKARERRKALIPFFVLLLSLLFLFFTIVRYAGITGKASLELETTFKANEPITGNLNLVLKQGELIPDKTSVILHVKNETYSQSAKIKLKELIRESALDIEEQKGSFYLENTEITGQGKGYGLEGTRMIFPFVYFKLEITGKSETGTELVEIVDGSATAGVPFTYALSNETESVGIINGSVYTFDEEGNKKELDSSVLDLEITSAEAIVTTNYSYQVKGFGSDFLSQNTTALPLNLSALNLAIENPGNYDLTINLSYEGITIVQTSIAVTIIPSNLTINHAPELLQPIPNQTLHANTNKTINLATYFYDSDNDTLSYSSTQPDNIEVVIQDNMATIMPAQNFVGMSYLRFNATDGELENESNLVVVEVTNTPPSLARNIGGIEITKNKNASLNLSWYFTDEDNDTLSYSSTQPENISVSIKADTALLVPATDFTGKRNITFYASDGINTTSTQQVIVNVTVLKTNHVPKQVATIPNQTLYKNEQAAVNLADYFIDEDNDTIIYNISEASQISNIVVTITNSTATILPQRDFTGNRTIIFTASDYLSTTASNLVEIFVIEKEKLNNAPKLIKQIPDINISKNTSVTIELADYFTDEDNDTLNFSSTQPENISVFINGSFITLVPATDFTGKRNITFYGDDGKLTTGSNLVTINVESTDIITERIVDETTIQATAVLGQPVVWMKEITLANRGNATIRLPRWATNISVEKIETTTTAGIFGIGAKETTLKLSSEASIRKITNQSNQEEIEVTIIDNANKYEISYETPAPQSSERAITTYKKTIEIFTPYNDLHYANITAFTTLPEIVVLSKKHAISLYHIVNGTKQLTDFTAYDLNNNNFIDRIEWLVPHLSNQTYETSITIINLQSYPALHGNWTVFFNTTGEADLTITAINGTTWNISNKCGNETCHLRFENLACGNTLLNYTWLENSDDGSNNSVFYANYTCNELGSETSIVEIAAKHTLKFQFGSDTAYAFNEVGQEVTGCTNITSPGVYNLTQSITDWNSPSGAVCINITASDVIFDCQGYWIDGTDTSNTIGIKAEGTSSNTLTNITIKNCNLTDWRYGIYYRYTENSTLDNITASSNSDDGIFLYSSSKNQVINSTIKDNKKYGLYLDYARFNNITGSRIENNSVSGYAGIYLYSSTSCTSTSNSSYNRFWNNIINNTPNGGLNWKTYGCNHTNYFNTTKQAGSNIIGGSWIAGNWWSDYAGVDNDGDGIGDSAYVINASYMQDLLPLVYPDITPPTTTLLAPSDGSIDDDSNVTFEFKATDNLQVDNCTLYTNISGIWQKNQTNTTMLNDTATELNITNIADDTTFKWNVECYDTASNSDWGDSNWSVTVNIWYSENVSFQINMPPTVTYVAPTENNNTNFSRTSIVVNVTVSQTEQNITFLLYNSTGEVNKTTSTSQLRFINWTDLPDGTYYYNVSVHDSVNNFGSTETRTITLDATNPLIEYVAPTENNNTNFSRTSIVVNVSVTEENFENITFNLYDSSHALLNSTNYSSQTYFINFTGLSDGSYYYNVTVFDFVSNSNSTPTRKITLDNTVPIINLTSPENGTISTTGNITFVFNVTENLGLVNCSLYHNIISWGRNQTNVTPQVGTNSFIVNNIADDTTFKWNVECYDTAGSAGWGESNRTLTVNKWYAENVSFKIDRPPVITWYVPEELNTSIFNLTGEGFNENVSVSDYALKEMNCTIYSDAALTKPVWSISINITGNTSYTKTSFVNVSLWKPGTYYEKCVVTDILVPG
jgi:parallel beta-helix repeat protein